MPDYTYHMEWMMVTPDSIKIVEGSNPLYGEIVSGSGKVGEGEFTDASILKVFVKSPPVENLVCARWSNRPHLIVGLETQDGDALEAFLREAEHYE